MLRLMWAVALVGTAMCWLSPAQAGREVVTTPGPTLVFQGSRHNPYPMAAAGQYMVSVGEANPCAPGARYEEILPLSVPPIPISLADCRPQASIVMPFRAGDILLVNPARKSFSYRTAPAPGWATPADIAMVRTTIEDSSQPWDRQHKLPRYFYFYRRKVTIVSPLEETSSSGRTGAPARLSATASATYIDLGHPLPTPSGPVDKLPRIRSAKIIATPAPMPAPSLTMTDCTPGHLLCKGLAFTPTFPGTYIVEYRLYDAGLGQGSAGYIGYWTHTATLAVPFPGF